MVDTDVASNKRSLLEVLDELSRILSNHSCLNLFVPVSWVEQGGEGTSTACSKKLFVC